MPRDLRVIALETGGTWRVTHGEEESQAVSKSEGISNETKDTNYWKVAKGGGRYGEISGKLQGQLERSKRL